MKKLLFGIFSLFLFVGVTQAQVEDPAKALKKVKSLLSTYNVNPVENSDKLDKAKEMIDFAMSDATVGGTYKALQTKGTVYSELAARDVQNYTLAQAQGIDDKFALKAPTAGVEAFEAFKMALGKAEKKYETKDALSGLQEIAVSLASIGNVQLSKKNYNNAFNSLNTILNIRQLLNKNDINTVLEDKEELNNHKFVVGYCAMVSDMKPEALGVFKDLIANDYHEEGRIYSYLFDLLKDDNEGEAMEYLNKGAAAYPENKEILFSKINYYIQKEDYKTLQGELEKAVEAAPDNPSVFSALGNVYMNLFQEEFAAGNNSVADAHFAKSLDYYNQALKLDDSLFDVQYSIGSLYYNKAVEITKLMNDLPISENKKYDAYNKEAKDLFTTGLPFFKKAEGMNPSDLNTLIALKEIFARLDDFEKSNEFKDRLSKVQAGEKITKSYF